MGGGHLPDWYDSDGREYTDCDLQKGKGGGGRASSASSCVVWGSRGTPTNDLRRRGAAATTNLGRVDKPATASLPPPQGCASRAVRRHTRAPGRVGQVSPGVKLVNRPPSVFLRRRRKSGNHFPI